MAGSDLRDLLLCHLEAAFHATLHIRGVYPPELFEPRRVLNLPVRIARHPALKEYVRNSVLSIKEAMLVGAVDKVELVILASLDARAEPVPIERHIFEVSTPLARADEPMSDDDLEAVEQNLRASLASIGLLDHRLPALQCETTFAIVVHTPEQHDLTLNEDLTVSAKWIPEPSAGAATSSYRETFAVKSFSRNSFRLSHYVETIELATADGAS